MFGLDLLVKALDRLTAQLAFKLELDQQDVAMQTEQTQILQKQCHFAEQMVAITVERLEREKAHIAQCEQRYAARLKEAKDFQGPPTIQ